MRHATGHFGNSTCDGTFSTFELAAAIDTSGSLYRAAGVYIERELE